MSRRPAAGTRVFLVVLAAALSLATAGSAGVPPPPAGFVQAAGTSLSVNGQPYRFTGINIYNAANGAGCWYPMTGGSTLGDSLSAISASGGPVAMRAWFFQGLATSGGVRDWSGFDHTLAVAAAHGTRVIVTLANQWPDCDGVDGGAGSYKDSTWYAGGYEQADPVSGFESYKDWVAEIVSRYKDNPTILAWQLLNEAEVKPSQSSTSCSPNASVLLKNFATDVSGLIKQIDPNHLVSLGTIGGGQCGTSGPEYQDVYSVPTLDLCEYHDYGSPTTPMPGDQFNGLAVRLNQCEALGKPLFVGETGITSPGEASSLTARAADFQAKFAAQFGTGVVGELAWAWNKDGSVGSYDIGPGDPTLAVLAHPGAPGPTGLSFSTDKGSFQLDTGPPTSTIDFEDYYPATNFWSASPAGTLVSFVSGGVTFSDPFRLGFGAIDTCDSTGDCVHEGTLQLINAFDLPQYVPQGWPKPMMTLPAGVCGVGLNLVSQGGQGDLAITFGATDATGASIGPTRFPAPSSPLPGGRGIVRWFAGVDSANPITRLTFPPGGSFPAVLSVELFGCKAPVDANPADGIVDLLQPSGTPTGSFVDSTVTPVTSGAIVDPAGNAVKITDAPAPDGVRITVTGSGAAKSVISACGFGTIQLAPGSDVTLTCGSVKLQVRAGSAAIVLGSGITVVTLGAGAAAEVSDLGAGAFKVATAAGSASVTVTTNGVATAVAAGATSTLAVVTAQNICNLTKIDIQSSAKYAALTAKQKQAVDALSTGACAIVQAITPKLTAKQKAALVAGYQQALQALTSAGWLTQSQATTLSALAAKV